MSILGDRLVPKAAPPPPAVELRISPDVSFGEFILVPASNDQGSLEPSDLRTTTDFSFDPLIVP